MIQKEQLIVYYRGSRGDFLTSILFGDMLETSYTTPWIKHSAAFSSIKYHDDGCESIPQHFLCVDKLTSEVIKQYYSVRIKIETEQDINQIIALANAKMGQTINPLAHNIEVSIIKSWETRFSKFDKDFNLVVPFADLWDVDKIEQHFYQVNRKYITYSQKHRIQHNININRQLIQM